MYSSFWVYQLWANYLYSKIQGYFLVQSISYDKDALYLIFENGKNQFSLEVKFVQGEIFFFESNKTATDHKSRGHFQFKEIDSQTVVDVGVKLFDRLLFIEFSGGYKLWFKGFGRFGNVILSTNDGLNPESMFKLNIKADWDIDLNQWSGMLYSNSHNCVSNWEGDKINVNNYHSIIKSISFEALIEYGFDPNFLNYDQKDDQREYLFRFFERIHSKIKFISSKKDDKINIESYFDNNESDTTLEDRVTQLVEVSTAFIRWFYFFQFKTSFIENAKKRIKQDSALIRGYLKRKEEIENRRSYREIGDLILAHAHSIKKGVSNALLMDYYTNQRIRVKLDENLTAADNAQKYYRKAKNEFLELEKLIENIDQMNRKILENQEKLIQIESATSFKDVKNLQKSKDQFIVPQKKNNNAMPYKLYEYEGFEFWVGKNAKSNDEILRLSNKNDLWLHVKDFTGSHVIIKQRGRNFPQQIIQAAAQLAAFHSKAKHQTLVQVQYALRKFVSKPKKAEPGEVNVLQESFIDVEPMDL